MIKYLCDRCGEEVSNPRALSEILIRKESVSVDSEEQRFELCGRCTTQMITFIKR